MLTTNAAPTTPSEQRAEDVARRAIKAVRTVMNLGTTAADEQQRKVLAGFPGWGPLAKAFDAHPQGTWADLADELDDVMGDLLGQAARIVDTSFFTPAALVAHVYELLQAAGFTGGSVLDLGCGAGAFLRGASADLVTSMTGVEVDPISARIAAALVPQATIITGELQGVTLPHARFDAAVGNVPFSASRVHDGALGFYGPLHEYFVLRALAAVRPGGYAVLVTSRHTLDAGRGLSAAVRDRADLIAAIRLPSGYFAASGTTVVADVLVLRVREDGANPLGWCSGDGVVSTMLTATVNGRH